MVTEGPGKILVSAETSAYHRAMTTPQEVLAKVPLFSMLSKKDLARLANNAHDRTFPAGAVLTEQDETGVTFGVIAEGQAAVSVHGQAARTLGPGDYFGEMALIDHSFRSATITAETELRCLLFTAWVFRPFALEHPETAWALLEVMVQRVRDAEAR
jgi:CRP/FNR family transcriptional regulator, cyclic AMP receptor protein